MRQTKEETRKLTPRLPCHVTEGDRFLRSLRKGSDVQTKSRSREAPLSESMHRDELAPMLLTIPIKLLLNIEEN